MLRNETLKKIYDDWYKRQDVLFEIVKWLGGRETSFLGSVESFPVRNIKAHSIKFLEMNFDAFKFRERLYNIYGSLAHLRDMPVFNFKPEERKRQSKEWDKEFENYVVGYDFALDFDAHNQKIEDVLIEVNNVKEILDIYNVPYILKSSGSGFHIEIKSKWFDGFDNSISFPERLSMINKIAKELVAVMNLQSVDLGIYDKRRIWKAPYSLDIKTGNVALPLSDDDFKNILKFNFDILKPENMKSVKNRGLLERKGDFEGLEEFYKEIILGQ